MAGPLGAIAPLAAVACLVLLRFPGVTLGLLIVATVFAEVEAIGVIPAGDAFYGQVISSLTYPDLLLLIGLAGMAIRCAAEGERPRLPEPLTLPLLLLAAALAVGIASGLSAEPPAEIGDLFHRAAHVSYLILVPLLAVNVMRGKDALKLFVAVLAALASLKGVIGLYASTAGVGSAVEDEVASFINPVSNLLMLTFILGAVATLVRHVRVPAWIYVGAPISLLALILSYRRSFWIALVFAVIVVVVIASRRRGRAVFALTAVCLALAVAAAATIGSSDQPSTSPLAERARTIAPGELGSNRGDRYRIDERRNVIENIESHPLTGIGLGVNWSVNQPTAEAHDRRYAHVAILWYWLAFGALGVLAYLALLGGALWTAVQIWRRHPDPLIQASAIAAFGTVVALIVLELTATFTGVETRSSLAIGAGLGWLAAAWQSLPRQRAGPPGAPA